MFQSNRRVFLARTGILATASLSSFVLPPIALANAPIASGSTMQKVKFDSGDSFVTGSLYLPAGYDPATRYPAVVVGGSLTAVKEMMGGSYASEMAKRGYLALSIDYRNYGESGGKARQFEDPAAKTEDLASAVTFLAARPDVRQNSIALLGVCTSGGTVLYGAARDPRVAAVASVASHLAEPSITPTLYGGPEGVEQRREAGRAARAAYDKSGGNAMILAYSNTDQSASHVGPMEYYMDKARAGGMPEWKNAFAVMSWEPWLDFDPISEAAKVTIPALVVHTDNCALPDQARKAYDLFKGPKKLHWTTGNHFDFYDGAAKITEAANEVDAHFKRSFA